MGAGRSGSTVLERTLDSSPKAFALGEFHCLWRLPWAQILCSCGARLQECGFWSRTLEAAGFAGRDLERLRFFENQIIRNRYLLYKRFSLRTLAQDPQCRAFLEIQSRLFDAILHCSGADILIDSSKAGPRAWILALDPQVGFLHIRRDAADTLFSSQRPKWDKATTALMRKRSLLGAAWDWFKVEHSSRLLAKHRLIKRLDYEKFTAAPKPALNTVLGAEYRDLVDSIAWVNETTVRPSAEYHSLQGNPDRYDKGLIRISFREPILDGFSWTQRYAIKTTGMLLDSIYP